jgi:hypothetical protein
LGSRSSNFPEGKNNQSYTGQWRIAALAKQLWERQF